MKCDCFNRSSIAVTVVIMMVVILILVIAGIGGGYGWNRVRREVQLIRKTRAQAQTPLPKDGIYGIFVTSSAQDVEDKKYEETDQILGPTKNLYYISMDRDLYWGPCPKYSSVYKGSLFYKSKSVGDYDSMWQNSDFDTMKGLAQATADHNWTGVMFYIKYVSKDFNADTFNAMTKAYHDLGLIVSITWPAWGPSCFTEDGYPVEDLDLTGINWDYVDFISPQLYYTNPLTLNYGRTQADTDKDPAALSWMKTTTDACPCYGSQGCCCPSPCLMNITDQVAWWGQTGPIKYRSNGGTLISPGYKKIAWALWGQNDLKWFQSSYKGKPELGIGIMDWAYNVDTQCLINPSSA